MLKKYGKYPILKTSKYPIFLKSEISDIYPIYIANIYLPNLSAAIALGLTLS